MPAIALPRRAECACDELPRWPLPAGGQGGSIALPARQSGVARPSVFPTVGSGAHGPITEGDYQPQGTSFYRRYPLPFGWFSSLRVRSWVDNVAGLLGFIPPQIATTGWTLNRNDGATTPASPIPYARRLVVRNYREEYDTTLWSNYDRTVTFQPSQGPRRVASGTYGRWRPGRPNNLTRVWPTSSYGSRTIVIAPHPPGRG